MSSPFLSGFMLACAVVTCALGAFFCIAAATARREAEYLIFGVLCLALTFTYGGLALLYGSNELELRMLASKLAHAGVIAAVPLNVHFVLRYARGPLKMSFALGLYGVSVIFQLVNALGYWWEAGSFGLKTSIVFGHPIVHNSFSPTPLAVAFYVIGGAQSAACLAIVVPAPREKKIGALVVFVGALLVGVAVLNDIWLITGRSANTLYAFPLVFLFYAFAVAATLLLRYRTTASTLDSMAESLRLRTSELRDSHTELQSIQRQLVEKTQLASVGELAAAIAHEVRNPLAVIVNAVTGLRRTPDSDPNHGVLLDIVQEETERLNHLVTDLLRFARPIRASRSPLAFDELFRQAQQVDHGEVRLVCNKVSDPALDSLWVDARLFRVVMENLVQNACQAMKGRGELKLNVERERVGGVEMARLDFIDEGTGMDRGVLDRAKDPFFTTRPSGTGLGLPIVHRIVKAHDGWLDLRSTPGSGTTASLFIPLGPPNPEASVFLEKSG